MRRFPQPVHPPGSMGFLVTRLPVGPVAPANLAVGHCWPAQSYLPGCFPRTGAEALRVETALLRAHERSDPCLRGPVPRHRISDLRWHLEDHGSTAEGLSSIRPPCQGFSPRSPDAATRHLFASEVPVLSARPPRVRARALLMRPDEIQRCFAPAPEFDAAAAQPLWKAVPLLRQSPVHRRLVRAGAASPDHQRGAGRPIRS